MTALGEQGGRNTFECVDSEPETVFGGGTSTNGALFYFVKAG